MRLAILLIYLNFMINARAEVIDWAYHSFWMKGEKEDVLKVSSELHSLYQTDLGEKIINRIGALKKRYHIVQSSKWGYNPKTSEIFIVNHQNSNFERYFFESLIAIINEVYSFDIVVNQKNAEKEILLRYSDYDFITIKGLYPKIQKLISVMNDIKDSRIGQKLFEDMKACNKELLIYHDKNSLSVGGYAGALKSSRNIFKPGIGESAYIRFRFDQPLSGSHIVKSKKGEIPFTYIDNLFHELVHAKHIMCGTFSLRDGEAQAIAQENEFRKSREDTSSWPERDASKYEEGRQVWFGIY